MITLRENDSHLHLMALGGHGFVTIYPFRREAACRWDSYQPRLVLTERLKRFRCRGRDGSSECIIANLDIWTVSERALRSQICSRHRWLAGAI